MSVWEGERQAGNYYNICGDDDGSSAVVTVGAQGQFVSETSSLSLLDSALSRV